MSTDTPQIYLSLLSPMRQRPCWDRLLIQMRWSHLLCSSSDCCQFERWEINWSSVPGLSTVSIFFKTISFIAELSQDHFQLEICSQPIFFEGIKSRFATLTTNIMKSL